MVTRLPTVRFFGCGACATVWNTTTKGRGLGDVGQQRGRHDLRSPQWRHSRRSRCADAQRRGSGRSPVAGGFRGSQLSPPPRDDCGPPTSSADLPERCVRCCSPRRRLYAVAHGGASGNRDIRSGTPDVAGAVTAWLRRCSLQWMGWRSIARGYDCCATAHRRCAGRSERHRLQRARLEAGMDGNEHSPSRMRRR